MPAKLFKTSIQDIVYNVEVGLGHRLIKTGVYILLLVVVGLLYMATQFKGLRNEEAMDQAQLARNISMHNKMITKYIRPVSLWYLKEKSSMQDPQVTHHPDIVNPPLYPLTLAMLFKVGKPDFVPKFPEKYKPEQFFIIPLGMCFVLLTGFFLYLIGRRLFNAQIAFWSATVYFLSNSVWQNAISGRSISMVVFLVTLSFYFSILAVENKVNNRSLRTWFFPFILSILFFSAAFLTKYMSIVALPGILLYVGFGFKRKGLAWVLLMLLGFLLCIVPWMSRNIAICKSPFGLAPYAIFMGTGSFPEDQLDRSLNPEFNKDSFRDIKIKFISNTSKLVSKFTGQGEGLLFCFFLVAFFNRFTRISVRLLRWGLLFSLLFIIVLGGLYGLRMQEMFNAFWPLIILYGVAYMFILVDRLQLQLKIAELSIAVLVVFFSALPLIFTLLPPRVSPLAPPYIQPYISIVSNMFRNDELICTDIPEGTAWYGNKNSLLLPATLEEFYDINDYIKRISGLYFTSETRNRPFINDLMRGRHRSWFPIMGAGRVPQDFSLPYGVSVGNSGQLILSDRMRW